VAEILSRRLKVRSQIPNQTKMVAGCMVADRKVWPDARAGAGLASPAGTGAGADAMSGHDLLTIAQPFMAGSVFNPTTKSRQGRKKVRHWRKILPSLDGTLDVSET